MHLLVVKNLCKSFPNTGSSLTVLNKINLSVSKNEFVTLIGPSGSGKSTLLDCISGLTSVDSGEIRLNNKLINNEPGSAAYMMQDDVLLPWRTLFENVALPLELIGLEKNLIKSKIENLAHIFGLSEFLNFYPSSLSGGMKQRTSLMRAYIQEKQMILLDEPFAKLDALLKIKLEEWFLQIWQKKKLSVLMVTHDIDEAIFLSDRIYVLSADSGSITKEISIPFKRPRTNDLITSTSFLAIKKELFKFLKLWPKTL